MTTCRTHPKIVRPWTMMKLTVSSMKSRCKCNSIIEKNYLIPSVQPEDDSLIRSYTASISAAAAIARVATPTLNTSAAPGTVTPLTDSTLTQAATPSHPTAVFQTASLAHDLDKELDLFLAKQCGCKRAGGNPCSTLFSKEHFQEVRGQCAEFNRDEFDLVLMGQIMATLEWHLYVWSQVQAYCNTKKAILHDFLPWWTPVLCKDIQEASWNRYEYRIWEHQNRSYSYLCL